MMAMRQISAHALGAPPRQIQVERFAADGGGVADDHEARAAQPFRVQGPPQAVEDQARVGGQGGGVILKIAIN
jgi:hypothetical protein